LVGWRGFASLQARHHASEQLDRFGPIHIDKQQHRQVPLRRALLQLFGDFAVALDRAGLFPEHG
jgi:hypothetical protein